MLEILSPGDPQHDLVRKKGQYEKFGVKECWIINPDTKEASGFRLKDGKYTEAFQFTGRINSTLLNREFIF